MIIPLLLILSHENGAVARQAQYQGVGTREAARQSPGTAQEREAQHPLVGMGASHSQPEQAVYAWREQVYRNREGKSIPALEDYAWD